MKKLTETYKFICKNYFPLFDRKKQWSVRYSSKLAADGFCDEKNKLIIIGKTKDKMSLQFIMVHEICHAVASLNHGNKWKARMLMAAKHASKIGEDELSTRIKDEIRNYDVGIKRTAQMIYSSIEDCIIDLPKASYKTVIKLVANEYGLPVEEFKRRYKRSRQIFEGQKKKD